MHVLFLDDAPKRWAYAKPLFKAQAGLVGRFVQTAAAAVLALEERPWDVLFLDHDLRPDVPPSTHVETGAEVVRRMIVWPWAHPRPTLTVVHSHNEEGSRYMTTLLNQNGFPFVRATFGQRAFDAVVTDLRRLVLLRS